MTKTTISYGRTFNRGNFESERIDVSTEIDEDQSPAAEFLAIKGMVLTWGGDHDGATDALTAAHRMNEAHKAQREVAE